MPLTITDGFGNTITVPMMYEQDSVSLGVSDGGTLTITPGLPSGVVSVRFAMLASASVRAIVSALAAASGAVVASAAVRARISAIAAAGAAVIGAASVSAQGSATGRLSAAVTGGASIVARGRVMTAPSAFTSGDWSVATDASTVTISTLPADGGSAITDIEYRVNSGSAVSLGETTTGTYAITASVGDDVQIRAVNAVGNAAWSDTKTAIDADAATYIAAVETADGQALESGVVAAINDFVSGCKSDGIWTAIRASSILAGARTLNGALVPLAGTAPTNFNFVSGDYNRKTGLVGDGATKYLDSGRSAADDPQNDIHFSIYINDAGTLTTNRANIGGVAGTSIQDFNEILALDDGRLIFRNRSGSGFIASSPAGNSTGFIGTSRSNGVDFQYRYGGVNNTLVDSSQTPRDFNITVFRRNGSSFYSDARIQFYSIGESLNLADLDTRVSALMTALDGAIA